MKRPWFWERLKAGEGDDRGWDGWMASLTQWTWVWASSRSWWWTGKAGMLQSMESQRVAHDWVTELKLLWSVGDENSSLLSFRSMLKHNASSDFILHCKHCLKKREIIMNRQNSVTPSRSTNWLLFITMTCKHFNSVIPTYHSFSLAQKKLC